MMSPKNRIYIAIIKSQDHFGFALKEIGIIIFVWHLKE